MRHHDFDRELPLSPAVNVVSINLSDLFWTCCQGFLTSISFQLDGAANGYDDDDSGGYSRGSRRPAMRKDRDDKVHDSIIEERIQRERPCRTLFIRNIKASTIRELPYKNTLLIRIAV